MNFEAVAKETFQILRSYDYEVLLFNDEHNQVFEPAEARRFFAKPENLLVSVVDDGEDSAVRLYLSKSTVIESVLGLVTAVRSMATKYKMIFHVRKYDRVLNPKDFATQASVSESKRTTSMNIVEGMYGTSRSSYLKLENARMIVRHSARINENVLGARGRNIETIHIENNVGERVLFPTTQLAPARAMTYHVDNGGSWADSVGEQIGRMATDFANLGACSRHVGFYGQELAESAQAVRDTVREEAREMRRVFEGMCRKTKYVEMCEALQEMAAQPLNESSHYAEKVTELASLLNTEAISLSESVLETVARTLEAAEVRKNAAKLTKEKNLTLTHILGRPVNKDAWEAFKMGKLDLIGRPDVEIPRGMNPVMAVAHKLSSLAAVVKDDSMVNLLAYVASQLEEPNAPPQGAKFVTGTFQGDLKLIGMKALKNAGIAEAAIAKGSEALREFGEWTRSFTVENMINEIDRLPEPHYEDESKFEELEQRVVENFRYEDFMAEMGSDFSYDLRDRLEDEEREYTSEQVLSPLAAYLERECDREGVHNMDMTAKAKELLPEVIQFMERDGYVISDAPVAEEAVDENCGICPGDEKVEECEIEEDLTSEDILLPKNQGDDLAGEVTKATVTDPDTGEEKAPDDSYIARLQSLAGMRNAGMTGQR